jgi:hypothetical protein
VQMFLSKDPQYWREAVMTRIAKWDREAGQSASDRFRSATCALIQIGASLGKAMGYAFDLDGIEAQLKQHWTKQVTEFEAERKTPADFVNGYVVQYLGDFAMVGGPKGDQIMNPSAPRRFMGEIRGVTANGGYQPTTVMIPMEHLRDYVRDRNGSFKAVAEWLASTPSVVRIGKLPFLEHTVQAITTQAVEFKHADVVGSVKPTLTVVPNPPLEQHA